MQQVTRKCDAVHVYLKQFHSNSFRVLFNVPTKEVFIPPKIKSLPRTRYALPP